MNVIGEFYGSDLGDERLDDRLLVLAELLGQRPSAAFTAIGNKAEVESIFRFVRNARVGLNEVLAPHIERTCERAQKFSEVIVVHDTTEFRFSGHRKDMGRLEKGEGFFGHVSFVLGLADKPEPLGVVGFEPFVRTGEKKEKQTYHARVRVENRESLRWLDGMRSSDEVLGEQIRRIHVQDREGDIYEQLAMAQLEKRSFVIRAAQNRRVSRPDNSPLYLRDVLENFDDKVMRKATLTKRVKKTTRHPKRAERNAKLKVSAGTVTFRRPVAEKVNLPATLTVNVVRVYEPNPPADEEPIEWILLTSEPIEQKLQIQKIVDIYRARWVIEEYFKALKTGCQIEKRQLRSLKTILTAIGLFVPIAWTLLVLRHNSRENPSRLPADFQPADILLLAKMLKRKDAPEPTAANFYKLIAELGGHWSSNGPPGWQVLYRGFEKYLLAKSVQALIA